MKVAVLGATGRIGRQIALEAHVRGHMITGISRGLAVAAPPPPFQMQRADVFDLDALRNVLQGHEALVSAYRGPPECHSTVADAAAAIIDAARDTGIKRLIFVGGAGTLEVSPGVRLHETDGFPDALRQLSAAHKTVIDILAAALDLNWTVFSPPAEIGPGDKVGGFVVSGRLVRDIAGNSCISYVDFATAVVDEMEDGKHVGALVTAAYP